jgi:hypothetical protein
MSQHTGRDDERSSAFDATLKDRHYCPDAAGRRSRRIVGVESPQVFQRLGGLDLCASVDLALTMVVEEEVDLSSEQVPLRGVRLPATEGNRRLGLRGRAGVGQLHPRAWHLERAWAPLLFKDEAKPLAGDVVGASPPLGFRPRQSTHSAAFDGIPVHSFHSLLADPGTLTKNTARAPNSLATFDKLANSAPLQHRGAPPTAQPLRKVVASRCIAVSRSAEPAVSQSIG